MSRSKSVESVGAKSVRVSAESKSKRRSEVTMALAKRARPLTRSTVMALSSSSKGTPADG